MFAGVLFSCVIISQAKWNWLVRLFGVNNCPQAGIKGPFIHSLQHAWLLKVRQIRNYFFKPTFLPKNEQTNSTLLLVDLFFLVFVKKVKKVKTPNRHFEINWPVGTSQFVLSYFVTSNYRKFKKIKKNVPPQGLFLISTFKSQARAIAIYCSTWFYKNLHTQVKCK